MPVLWPCVHAANGAAVNSPAVPVITSKVTQEDVASYRTGIGTVQPMQSVTIKARVDGQLEKVAFTEGQDIKQGDLLAQIDPRPYQTQLNQALAQKAHDEASLTAALKDLDRYTKLVAQGVIQRQTLDAQQATVDQLKANLQSDQAQIENARVQLGYTTIRSPVNGRAGMRLIDAGNMVRAADTNGLVVINQIDPIAVLFTLPEDDFQTVNQAIQKSGKNSLSVTALARHGDTPLGTGRLLLLNNQIDTSTGTFQLKALFPNPMHALWPGQYVNVRLQVGARRTVLTVPESAVQRGPDGLFVYVVQPDSTVTAQTIRTAQTQDGKTVIDEGLAVGERVVVDGQFKIKPGTKVVEARQTAIPAANAKQQTSARP
ncbi:MAG: efflux RND transporter periplasmic adaptor subunit [Steroidobacteraceae bacterium]